MEILYPALVLLVLLPLAHRLVRTSNRGKQ